MQVTTLVAAMKQDGPFILQSAGLDSREQRLDSEVGHVRIVFYVIKSIDMTGLLFNCRRTPIISICELI